MREGSCREGIVGILSFEGNGFFVAGKHFHKLKR